jgi:hypothetical protein
MRARSAGHQDREIAMREDLDAEAGLAGKLATEARFADPDRAFRLLIEARRDLTPELAAALDARLVLLLANHIGTEAVLEEAIRAARLALGLRGP